MNNHMINETSKIITGEAVSEGIALGYVFLYQLVMPTIEKAYISANQSEAEFNRWLEARSVVEQELDSIIEGATRQPLTDMMIFEFQKELLFDEEVEANVKSKILEECLTAEHAVKKVFDDAIALIKQVDDLLIVQRETDLRDVRDRLLRKLLQLPQPDLSNLPDRSVLVAADLLPSDTASLNPERVSAIVTETGSSTSHSAILARGLGIPAVLGVSNVTSEVRNGQEVIVDALKGRIILSPNNAQITNFRKQKSDYEGLLQKQGLFIDKAAALADGTSMQVGINIGDDRVSEDYAIADFVGLFRTEFLYMEQDHLPTEDEQVVAYTNVLRQAGNKPVTLRTLDIGGDKNLPYLELPKEENPFLGKRAIRLCFDRYDIFITQLVAVLRASVVGNVQIMFPFVSSMDDIRKAKACLNKAKEILDRRGVAYNPSVRYGVMIETPSIAIISDLVAKEVDFASIGTNDLCQYLTATDRMNADVRDYYQDFSPAMLRILQFIIKSFNDAGKEISLCGELASNVYGAILLAGMGLRKLSVQAKAIARIKEALSKFTRQEAENIIKRALLFSTEDEVKRHLQSLMT